MATGQVKTWMDSRCVQILSPGPNYRWNCKCCQKPFTGGQRKFINHILGITDDPSARVSVCVGPVIEAVKTFCEAKHADSEQKKRQRDEAAAQERRVRHAVEKAAAESRAAARAGNASNGTASAPISSPANNTRQLDLEGSFAKAHKHELDIAFASMLYEVGLPFTFAQQESVREFCNQLVKHGADTGSTFYNPPGKDRLRNQLLIEVQTTLSAKLVAFNATTAKHGVTLATDGKDDAHKEHAENAVLVSPHGWQWVGSEDTSGERRNAAHIAAKIQETVDSVDKQLLERLTMIQSELDNLPPVCQKTIVQVVTDTPSANANAWPIIEENMEWLMANPCTLHGLGLHFKHCEKGDSTAQPPLQPIDQVAELNAKAKIVEQHFSNRDYPKKALGLETTKRERFGRSIRVRKFSETRMGNMYRVWHRLQRLKECLATVINSTGYKENVKENGESEEARHNQEVREILEDADFWNMINALVEIMEPAYSLLRLCDGYQPSAGKFYYYALQLQNHYNDMTDKYSWAEQFADFWRADWDYIGCAFHAAGFMLDPEFVKMDKPEHCMVDLLVVAERMLKAAPPELGLTINNITVEMAKFTELQGTFSEEVVQSQIKTSAGYMWWQMFGAGCPTLQWLAVRILAQTTSAAAAESAWSEFDFVFNRRRSRLGKETASRLVYVHCNSRLLRRFQKVRYNENWVKPADSESECDEPLDNVDDLCE